MDVKEEEILGSLVETHWYYRSKAQAVCRALSGISFDSVLDIGAGSGFFSRYLLRSSNAKRALCIDIEYTEESDGVEGDKPIQFRRAAGGMTAELVLLMDVLEHVEDDRALLSAYVDAAPSGTWFLISVPAFRFLWSDHDIFLGHHRRYRLSQLEALVLGTGLSIQRGFYFFGIVFPLAAGLRLFQRLKTWIKPSRSPQSQLKQHHPLMNRILLSASLAEIPLMRSNRLVGLTAFCLARKS